MHPISREMLCFRGSENDSDPQNSPGTQAMFYMRIAVLVFTLLARRSSAAAFCINKTSRVQLEDVLWTYERVIRKQ